MLQARVDGLSITDSVSIGNANYSTDTQSCWGYWQDHYYPTIIRESYPVYFQERAKDSGKQAFVCDFDPTACPQCNENARENSKEITQ